MSPSARTEECRQSRIRGRAIALDVPEPALVSVDTGSGLESEGKYEVFRRDLPCPRKCNRPPFQQSNPVRAQGKSNLGEVGCSPKSCNTTSGIADRSPNSKAAKAANIARHTPHPRLAALAALAALAVLAALLPLSGCDRPWRESICQMLNRVLLSYNPNSSHAQLSRRPGRVVRHVHVRTESLS